MGFVLALSLAVGAADARNPCHGRVFVVLVLLFATLMPAAYQPLAEAAIGASALALFLGSVVGARRSANGRLLGVVVLAPLIVTGATVLIVLSTFLQPLMSDERGRPIVQEVSPSGDWTALLLETAPLPPKSAEWRVLVVRDVAGMLQLERYVFTSDIGEGSDGADRPQVRWINERIVSVSGVPIDIREGSMIDLRANR